MASGRRAEGLDRAGARVSAASGREGDAGAGTPSCCVCMEPWTCNGAHRICCIPCGHVYGRSRLESWLQRCGNTRAKCPQCGKKFKLKHITNLYAPGNLWDGCCHIQECEEKIAIVKEALKKLSDKLDQIIQKLEDHDLAVRAKAFESMKEQMKKMVEQNAAPMDLIDFLEQSYAQLQIRSCPQDNDDSPKQ